VILKLNIKDQTKIILWKLVDKHYNVDRDQPQILTAKNILGSNPIDQIGTSLGDFMEETLKQALEEMVQSYQVQNNQEDEEDNYPYLYLWED